MSDEIVAVRRGSVLVPRRVDRPEPVARPVIFPVPVSQFVGDVYVGETPSRLFTYVFPETATMRNMVVLLGSDVKEEQKGSVMADLMYNDKIEMSVPLVDGVNTLGFDFVGEQYSKVSVQVWSKEQQTLRDVNVSFTVGIEKEL